MSLKVIKLTTPWKHDFFYSQTPKGHGIIGDYKFEINNDCQVCDYWVIWGGLNPGTESETVKCPRENVLFMADEVHHDRFFYQKFLNQFPTVVSTRKDISHRNLIHCHEINTWHLKKSYDEVISESPILKSKNLCIISSDLVSLEGHKKRYAFVNKLIGHFKDRIDVYGRGFQSFDDKYEVLAPYKYTIAIENSNVNGYFTEKLSECFLTHTLPIYYGCPDLEEYYDSNSFYRIDIADYKESIKTIEKILEEDIYAIRLKNIIDAKYIYLTKYNLFPGIIEIIKTHLEPNFIKKKVKVKIKKEQLFTNYYYLKRIIQIYNNRSFVPDRLKFDINFRYTGKISKK